MGRHRWSQSCPAASRPDCCPEHLSISPCAPRWGARACRWQSAFYIPGLLTPARWRKSSQWKALLRSHAELVAADTQLAPRFERECYSYQPPT